MQPQIWSCTEQLVTAGDGRVDPIRGLEAYTDVTGLAVNRQGDHVAAVVSSGTSAVRVVTARLDGSGATVRRYGAAETVPPGMLSNPRPVSWTSFDGEAAHGIYYPPASDRFMCDGPAPLVVVVHGGPTSQVVASWTAQAQFLATRGYGVLLPNYRGSTGYGRAYMLKLRETWGIFDVEDARAGARHLVDTGEADGSRLVIMGGVPGAIRCSSPWSRTPGSTGPASASTGCRTCSRLPVTRTSSKPVTSTS